MEELTKLKIMDLLHRREFESARASVLDVLAAAPGDGEARYFMALLALGEQNIAQAKAVLRELIASLPQHVPALGLLGSLLTNEQDSLEARRCLATALLLDRSNESWYALWQASRHAKTYQQALPADVVFATGTPFLKQRFGDATMEQGALGGSESAVVYMARAFAALGCKVAVFCNCDQPGMHKGVDWRPLEELAFYARTASTSLFVASRFVDLLDQPLHAKHRVLWLHDIAHTEFYRRTDLQRYRADVCFALSAWHRENMLSRYPALLPRMEITRNGFDEGTYPEPSYQPRPRRIIYASRPSRGLDEFLTCVELLRKDFPELEGVVCTYSQFANMNDDPELAPHLQRMEMLQIQFKQGLAKGALADLLRSCRLMVYPNVSVLETSCIAAIEAMAAGTPVIAGDRCALPETLGQGKGGALIPWGEGLVQGLVAAALPLLRDDALWAAKAQEARAWVASRYTWKAVAEQWQKRFSLIPRSP